MKVSEGLFLPRPPLRNQPILRVSCGAKMALELAADLASCGDPLVEGHMLDVLRGCVVDASSVAVRDVQTYRLKHHMLQAAAVATGSKAYARRAVEVAWRAPHLERLHLGLYGWPLDEEVVARYSGRLADDSERGMKAKPYHEGMLEIAPDVLHLRDI